MFITKIDGGYEENADENDPVTQAELLVEHVITLNKPIIIDMTSMSTEVLFILIKAFHHHNFDDIIIIYVQPQEYKKNNQSNGIMPDFLLSEDYAPVSAIPGFLRLPDEEKEPRLIVFMGFEGGRFKELCEHLLTEGTIEIVPILPMPSFKAGWHMLGIYLNLDTLKSNDIIRHLKRVTAWDPFFALAVLEEQYKNNSDSNQLIVAPIGTKPHTLASVLFAVRHESVRIMYDHPIVHGTRTEGIGAKRGYYLKGVFSS
ncbi:hypothetical protein D3C81_802500 [compost metagenome]